MLNSGFGYDHVEAQLMTVPVYVVAFVGTLALGLLSDKYGQRGAFFVLGQVVGIVGWGMGLAGTYSSGGDGANPNGRTRLRYAGCFVNVLGSFGAVPCALALGSQNLASETKRAAGLAIQVTTAAIGACAAGFLFPARTAPLFRLAHWFGIGSALGAIAAVGVYLAMLARENRRKRESVSRGEAQRYTREELFEMGDASPFFVYRF